MYKNHYFDYRSLRLVMARFHDAITLLFLPLFISNTFYLFKVSAPSLKRN